MHLWVCSVFFPYPVTFLLQLQARIHSPPHLKTHSVSYFEVDHLLVLPVGLQMSTALLCLLLSLLPSVNLSIPLFLPLSLPASLFITPSAVSPHSHSPVSFGLISSSITASHLPSFRLLPSCISNLSIVSPLPLFSKPLVIAPLSSPPLLTGTILHSAPSLAGWAGRVCVFVTFAFSLKQSRTHWSGWYNPTLFRAVQVWIVAFRAKYTDAHTKSTGMPHTQTCHCATFLLPGVRSHAGPLSEDCTLVEVRKMDRGWKSSVREKEDWGGGNRKSRWRWVRVEQGLSQMW